MGIVQGMLFVHVLDQVLTNPEQSNEGAFGFDGTPGSARIQYLPTSLAALEKEVFVQVACGGDHCLALTATGFVYVWGTGEMFQLGRRVLERHKKHGTF